MRKWNDIICIFNKHRKIIYKTQVGMKET
jgi:hypothetical protein